MVAVWDGTCILRIRLQIQTLLGLRQGLLSGMGTMQTLPRPPGVIYSTPFWQLSWISEALPE